MQPLTISNKTLVLASSSPRRQELIRTLGIPYRIAVSDADETVELGLSPAEIVETLSLRKALVVLPQCRISEIVIGSDTIVVVDNEVLGKPKDAQDAAVMLERLQGRTHEVYSGIACIDAEDGRRHVSHRVTKVTIKPLLNEQIQRYIATGEPLDKAGSYGIQGLGATIVEGIEGDYFNVVGLPLSLLSELLTNFGLHVI